MADAVTEKTNEESTTENSGTDWDPARQHADEIRAASVREVTLQSEKSNLVAENERLQAAIDAAGSEADANDMDSFEGLSASVRQLQGTVADVTKENLSLKNQVASVQENANTAAGNDVLKSLLAGHESRLGRNDLTNDVKEAVEDRYKEQGINSWPPAQKSNWISQELKIEYDIQNLSKPKATATNGNNVNLAGTGTGEPAKVLSESSSEDSKAFMREKYPNTS